jgi:hypothetical protein
VDVHSTIFAKRFLTVRWRTIAVSRASSQCAAVLKLDLVAKRAALNVSKRVEKSREKRGNYGTFS